MSSHQESLHLTLPAAAEMLGVQKSVLDRWARDGRIPSTVTPEGVRVFRRSDLLERWVTAASVPGEQDEIDDS